MKLYLVADYDIGGKRFATTFAIDGSNNLTGLTSMTCLSVLASEGTFLRIQPSTLHMCKTAKEANTVAAAWNETYQKDGKLYDFKPNTVISAA